jgi:hypothetical protein
VRIARIAGESGSPVRVPGRYVLVVQVAAPTLTREA